MHTGIYREWDAGTTAHTYSLWTTTLSVLGEKLPPVHYMIALAGGRISVAEYATYGTVELAANTVETIVAADTSACLLTHRSVVTTGETVADAVSMVTYSFACRTSRRIVR